MLSPMAFLSSQIFSCTFFSSRSIDSLLTPFNPSCFVWVIISFLVWGLGRRWNLRFVFVSITSQPTDLSSTGNTLEGGSFWLYLSGLWRFQLLTPCSLLDSCLYPNNKKINLGHPKNTIPSSLFFRPSFGTYKTYPNTLDPTSLWKIRKSWNVPGVSGFFNPIAQKLHSSIGLSLCQDGRKLLV